MNKLTTQVGRLVGVIAAVVVTVASPTRRDAVLPRPGTARELISTARRCTHTQWKPTTTVITSLLTGKQSRLVPAPHANSSALHAAVHTAHAQWKPTTTTRRRTPTDQHRTSLRTSSDLGCKKIAVKSAKSRRIAGKQ